MHRSEPSVSRTVHYLRMGDALGLTNAERQEAIGVLLGTGTFSAIVRTRTGLRFHSRVPKLRAPGPFVEAHFAQAVSELLLQEIGPNAVVQLEDGEGRFEDLIQDLVSNYWPRRFVFEWTALALLESVPPRRSWVTKHGDRFDWDSLARALLEQVGAHGSCANLHLVEVMAHFQAIDRNLPLLSSELRGRVAQYIASVAEMLRENQSDEGWWSASWREQKPDHAQPPHRSDRLAITAHILELVLLYPELDRGVRRDAARNWLIEALVLGLEEPSFVQQNYCSVTYAFRAIHLQL